MQIFSFQRANQEVSVLFSEPKIPQSTAIPVSERANKEFQCSSASRKFLNRCSRSDFASSRRVSVLFSEPKIPQSLIVTSAVFHVNSFSALQRAENSSIVELSRPSGEAFVFQCSSASRKFLNNGLNKRQRRLAHMFQCSSASRKFLNRDEAYAKICQYFVSVLFSEPKIPQSYSTLVDIVELLAVSVLFSEPKIPQLTLRSRSRHPPASFQCSSASRKFLNSITPSAT